VSVSEVSVCVVSVCGQCLCGQCVWSVSVWSVSVWSVSVVELARRCPTQLCTVPLPEAFYFFGEMRVLFPRRKAWCSDRQILVRRQCQW
jgi:hypothetical protein